jgi:eukaryotic-like serine/threonine-protein kinase
MTPSQGHDGQLKVGEQLLNRYLIEETIGIGGMGAVYRGRDMHFPSVEKLVAVKEMFNQAHDPEIRNSITKNFEREANLLATLSHPAIPRIYDYFTIQERSYLVLEYIPGKNLDMILRESSGFIPVSRVVGWAIEICDVLQYLHAHQPEAIIFRDMKPSNVMVNQHDQVVLIDFGIAKSFQFGEKGTMVGTEGYAPPEQYRGEATILADIYGLGATLHHLLSNRDPRKEPPFSFLERPIRQINPEVPLELEHIVNTALQYDPVDRFQSADEMKMALIDIARKQSPAIQAIARQLSTHTDGPQPLWTFKCEDEIRGSATVERGTVLFGSYDHNLYCLNMGSGKLNWKYMTDGGIVSRPIVVGDNVCFGSEDHRIHMVSARTGTVQWTYFTRGPIRSSPCIAHGHIFIGSDDFNLHAINLSSGRAVWNTGCGAPIRSTPIILNDSICFGNEAGDFFCLDFRGLVRWRFKAKRAITSSPAIAENLILFASLDGYLYALDVKSGWLVWRFRMDKGSISSPCIHNNSAFVGSIDGNIYAVDLRTAKEIWRFQTGHQVNGSPIIHKEMLYCSSVDGSLYCLDPQTGELKWKFACDKPLTASPVAYDQVIFIGSTNHLFYALPAFM